MVSFLSSDSGKARHYVFFFLGAGFEVVFVLPRVRELRERRVDDLHHNVLIIAIFDNFAAFYTRQSCSNQTFKGSLLPRFGLASSAGLGAAAAFGAAPLAPKKDRISEGIASQLEYCMKRRATKTEAA